MLRETIPEVKIVVVGDGSVGKSSLTMRFVTNHFEDEYDPSIEDFYHKQIVVDGLMTAFSILDTAGCGERFFPFRSSNYDLKGKAVGFMVVYSIDTRISFEEAQLTFEEARSDRRDDKENTFFLLVGNKIDLSERRKVTTEEGQTLAAANNAQFAEISAKCSNQQEIEDVFASLSRAILGTKVPQTGRRRRSRCLLQ